MTPKQYEDYIGALYAEKGYNVTVSPLTNDWGIDVIATKGSEKIGIQAKMYGESRRKVNRRVITLRMCGRIWWNVRNFVTSRHKGNYKCL